MTDFAHAIAAARSRLHCSIDRRAQAALAECLARSSTIEHVANVSYAQQMRKWDQQHAHENRSAAQRARFARARELAESFRKMTEQQRGLMAPFYPSILKRSRT